MQRLAFVGRISLETIVSNSFSVTFLSPIFGRIAASSSSVNNTRHCLFRFFLGTQLTEFLVRFRRLWCLRIQIKTIRCRGWQCRLSVYQDGLPFSCRFGDVEEAADWFVMREGLASGDHCCVFVGIVRFFHARCSVHPPNTFASGHTRTRFLHPKCRFAVAQINTFHHGLFSSVAATYFGIILTS